MPGWVGRARQRLLGAGAGGRSPRCFSPSPLQAPAGDQDIQMLLGGQGQQEILDHGAWGPVGMI